MSRKCLFNKINSDDALQRCDAIEELAKSISSEKVAEEILKCFCDKNFLVRCEAYDAFYGYTDSNIYPDLLASLKKEKSKYARMHLCSTLCSIIKKTGCTQHEFEIIHKCYLKEKKLNVLLAYWCIFYIVEKDKSYIERILSHINDRDYHIRCNVVNLLADVEDDYVKETAVSEYRTRLLKEDSLAVRSLLDKTLEKW